MKFFNKRAATAMLLALSMMGTCISPAFAEGSREFNQVPDESNISEYAANRPYFEWRDRGQFGMPSRNIMYVYAKAGETIYFGSDVVTANDKSIEAVTHSEVSFTQTLNSEGQPWAGSSIAVTLPISDSKAYDPVGCTDFDNLFVAGGELEKNLSPETDKVYLFKPTENGKGHIANPTMEKNGPNGVVRKDAETATTDGYDPLSFVAPYTGTYSFRFLSREFVESDRPMDIPTDPNSLNMISIDFKGEHGELAAGTYVNSTRDYYEPGFGFITLYGVNNPDRDGTVTAIKTPMTAPATEYSKAVTYDTEDVYWSTGNAQANAGAIEFTPLHDNAELEIVWDSDNDGQRQFSISQGTRSDSPRISSSSEEDKLSVIRISSIGGQPIKAGVPIQLHIQVTSGVWGAQIYEIRYYYNRTEIPSVPVPTAQPAPIVYSESITFDELVATEGEWSNPETVNSSLTGDITLTPSSEDGDKIVALETPIPGNEKYTKEVQLAPQVSGGNIIFSPQHDNAWIEVVWGGTDANTELWYMFSGPATKYNIEECLSTAEDGTSIRTDKLVLRKNWRVKLYTKNSAARIYEIIYHYNDRYPFEAVEKSVDFSSVETHTTDGFDTTISDPEFGEVTFYSSDSRGYKTEELTETEELTWGSNVANYDIGYKRLYFDKASNGIGDLNNLGAAIGIKPKHEDVSIVVRWRSINYENDLSICMGGTTNSTHRRQTLSGGEIAETTLTGFPKDVLTHIYFDRWGAQIYEIIYKYPGTVVDDTTGGVEAASFFAADDAAETAYAKWKFGTTNELEGTKYTLSTVPKDVIPTLSATKTNGSPAGNKKYKVPQGDYQWTGIDGEVFTITGDGAIEYSGPKMESETVLTLDSNLSETTQYSSYDLKVVYMHATDSQDASTLMAYVGDSELKPGSITNGAGVIGTLELTGSTAETIDFKRTNKELMILYVGLKYNPAPTLEPVNPKPVSVDYTWDFYYMEGDDETTAYTKDTIVGKYPEGENGKDYDHDYVYDLKAHAPVSINNTSLMLTQWAKFDTTGVPDGAALEMVPAWSGTVEVVYKNGTAAIRQNGVETSGENADSTLKKVTVRVTPWNPVYIYAVYGMPYIQAVKYIPDEPPTEFSERGVAEPWVTTPSLVAAWDITVASPETEIKKLDSTSWDIHEEFSNPKKGENSSKDEKLKLYYGSETAPDSTTTITYENADAHGVKINGIKDNNQSNVFKFTPDSDGEVTLYAWQIGVSRIATIAQGVSSASMTFDQTKTMKTVSLDVVKGEEVLIYSNEGVYFHKIVFTPYEKVATDTMLEKTGRAWTDILFLNAGAFKSSIYPQFNVLTRDGFLYDVKFNGIQPWSFAFYSNNRGFLLDSWSLYSNPELSLGPNAEKDLSRLQALEHSFYSFSSKSDVGPAPQRIEKTADGIEIEWNENIMKSAILGNYIPIDDENHGNRDVTHKIFFNAPDDDSLKVYTDPGKLKEVSDKELDYANILNNIYYEGVGTAATIPVKEPGAVNYGTVGIGGRFMLTVTPEEATRLKGLGSNSMSILLDFSEYELDEKAAPIANIPVIDDKGEWKKIAEANLNSRSDFELNNKVSLSAVIDTSAAATGENAKAKEYIISWDGRDAYGNVVPPGVYSDGVKSFIEMGMAHFPILDAEHNPNGIKIQMVNDGNKFKDYIYYNNEAVSPRNNPDDPSAWYYTGRALKEYPDKIGDGLNKTAGVSTNFEDNTAKGGMYFNQYTNGEYGSGEADDGYGNFAGLDIWSKYEREIDAKLTIGVKAVEILRPYVSFVATNGTVEDANASLPFKISHVGYAGRVREEYPDNRGSAVTLEGEKFGNTISTGFIANVSSPADTSSNWMTWDITIPANGELKSSTIDPETGNVTTNIISMPTFIKIPKKDVDEEKLTNSESSADAQYLAYELYSGLFEDYPIDAGDDEVNVGDEFMPDWEADASLNADSEPGIMDIPDNAEIAAYGLTEEMYIEAMSLLEEEEGNYKAGDGDKKWDIAINVEMEPTLSDDANVKANQGNIHKVQRIGEDANAKANIKVGYKLPTIVTGPGAVRVGIVIDNLYAPGATATAQYTDSEISDYQYDMLNIVAKRFEEYAHSKYNEYYAAYHSTIPEPKENEWVMSEKYSGCAAGTELMKGLFTLFTDDKDKEDSIGGSKEGNNVNDPNRSALKYVAWADGTLSVSVRALGSADSPKTLLVVTEDGSTNTLTATNHITQSGGLATITANVKEGTTYYIYGHGTKVDFTGASFTPGTTEPDPEQPERVDLWEAALTDENRKMGDELIPGLTMLFDNNAEPGKSYIVAEGDAKWNADKTEVISGAGFKYVAPANGTLEIGVGSSITAGKFVGVVTDGYTKDDPMLTYPKETTEGAEAGTFRFSVEAGKTYYIYGDGTKPRFTSAKFTAN